MKNFSELHEKNLARLSQINQRLSASSMAEYELRVREIIDSVKTRGDAALLEYSLKFDSYEHDKKSTTPFVCSIDKNNQPNFRSLPEDLREALLTAKERITKFHISEFNFSNFGEGWTYEGELGERLGVRYRAIDSVAVYVPAGKAPLVSTVLMTVIPARVSGVNRVVLVSPPPISTEILAAAEICGVDEVIALGGAQAIAALAYGTQSIKAVDKIVGPGNIYVSLAKKFCFGQVGIDGIYGPSELAIIADETARADFIAADLLSQLEHGSGLESTLFVTTSSSLIDEVHDELHKQIDALAEFKTKEQIQVIRDSLANWSALLLSESIDDIAHLINTYAPEHLEILVRDSVMDKYLDRIQNAGAIFLGGNSCESLGDYAAGPSHSLPTGGTARFSSGLQCSDFVKRSSIIDFSKISPGEREFNDLLNQVALIARAENLEAHARAAELRME